MIRGLLTILKLAADAQREPNAGWAYVPPEDEADGEDDA